MTEEQANDLRRIAHSLCVPADLLRMLAAKYADGGTYTRSGTLDGIADDGSEVTA